jgi:alpha-amylase
MKSICLCFQVHQPFRFRRYRFFDIGKDHYYYDDYANETIMQKVVANCYLPANELLLKLINEYGGKFKVAFSITGIALEQFELYAPKVIKSFQNLAKTGSVEFLAETYSHSLVSLNDKLMFEAQVKQHSKKIVELFGQKPKVFRNTEMIYSDEIGSWVADMGFEGMLTEGAKHILGWKSPNFVYVNAINPRLKVLMRNYEFSDDIAFRFSRPGWDSDPLTAEKFVDRIHEIEKNDEILNLFIDYESIGEHQKKETGIFDFMRAFPAEVFKTKGIEFATPSEIVKSNQPIAAMHVPNPISRAGEERDLIAWLGNDIQKEAFNNLYNLKDRMTKCDHKELIKDWNYLQVSDHFYYMSTKVFSEGEDHNYLTPYNSPYEAFINYMNVLSDFKLRLNSVVPEKREGQDLIDLNKIIEDKQLKIVQYEAEIKKLQQKKKKSFKNKK